MADLKFHSLSIDNIEFNWHSPVTNDLRVFGILAREACVPTADALQETIVCQVRIHENMTQLFFSFADRRKLS